MGEHPERSFSVSFAIGETVEDCYTDVRRQWWGDPESLHLDCWGAVEQADGYDVSLVAGGGEPTADRLFEVDKAVDLSAMLQREGYAIRLGKADQPKPFAFTCNYVPIA